MKFGTNLFRGIIITAIAVISPVNAQARYRNVMYYDEYDLLFALSRAPCH